MDPAAQVILGEGGPEKGIRPEDLLQVARKDLIPLDLQETLAGGEDRPLPVVPGQEAGDIRGGSQLAVKGDADVSAGINEGDALIGYDDDRLQAAEPDFREEGLHRTP